MLDTSTKTGGYRAMTYTQLWTILLTETGNGTTARRMMEIYTKGKVNRYIWSTQVDREVLDLLLADLYITLSEYNYYRRYYDGSNN